MSNRFEPSYLDDGLAAAIDKQNFWVIPKSLCTRCGACHVICPTNVIDFDSQEFPFIQTQGCIDCGLCLKVCPGIEFDIPGEFQRRFGQPYSLVEMGGAYRKAYVGYSTDPSVRKAGSSGGVVTQILMAMLNAGMVDGALVVGSSPDDPLTPLPYIARTEEEIRSAAQSKYVVVANTKVLRELRQTKEKVAFVGIPCQLHGLIKLQALNKRLEQRVALTIGLACRGTLEREVVPEFLQMRHIDPQSVKKLGFRDGPYPGQIRAHFKDGRVQALHKFEIKDGAYNNLFRLYLPDRCISCPDYSAEFSDVMCSDIWSRGSDGEYLYPEGVTLVLCRTERGEKMIDSLVQSGHLALQPISEPDVEKAYKRLHWEKKVLPFVRIAQQKRSGRRVPEYGLDVPVTLKDRLLAFLIQMTFIFGKNPHTRRFMLRVLFSPIGETFAFLKIKYKKYRYRFNAGGAK
jgi:coenzyme F420 hydrogenase subunit beta